MTLPSPYATVRVSVDFPGAENVWVVAVPVYPNETIVQSLATASEMVINGLARDAGQMFAERRDARG